MLALESWWWWWWFTRSPPPATTEVLLLLLAADDTGAADLGSSLVVELWVAVAEPATTAAEVELLFFVEAELATAAATDNASAAITLLSWTGAAVGPPSVLLLWLAITTLAAVQSIVGSFVEPELVAEDLLGLAAVAATLLAAVGALRIAVGFEGTGVGVLVLLPPPTTNVATVGGGSDDSGAEVVAEADAETAAAGAPPPFDDCLKD